MIEILDGKAIHRLDGTMPFRIREVEAEACHGFGDKAAAKAEMKSDIKVIRRLQECLYAEKRQSLLVVLQALDAGGKDGTIKHVFGRINPLGVRAFNFRAPTHLELAHDFLWRIHQRAPAKGMISIFNLSQYEDFMVVKVHGLADPDVIERRYEQINAFEQHLSDCGTRILKFLLFISRDEQKKRLQALLDRPEKHWKFNPKDLDDRARWDDFMEAYETAINRCAAPHAPWYVIPANRRWHRNAAVAHVTRRTLESMNPVFPEIDFDPASVRIP